MTTKAEFLQHIRQAVDAGNSSEMPQLPAPPEVWPVLGDSLETLRSRFADSIATVAGECVSCLTFEDAVNRIAELLRDTGASTVALPERPLSGKIAARLDGFTWIKPPENPETTDPKVFATYDAALWEPEYLLADSGSALFRATNPFERLAVYLPPLCLAVAPLSALREHFPHAWQDFLPRWKEGKAGEFVVVTGPSRTADIEKILILGVHGPKRFIVFLVEEA